MARDPAHGGRAWVVPAVAFLVIWGLTTHGKYSASGDEPHYLLVARSLVVDHDIDLGNNYAANDGKHIGHDNLQVEGHARVAPSGRLLPVHDVGLPVLIAPVYAVAAIAASTVPEDVLRRFRMSPGLFAYSIVSLAMAALACLGAWLLLVTLGHVGAGGVPGGATVLAMTLSPPVLSNAFLVFPEVPALLVTCLVLWTVYRRSPSPRALAVAILALGLLPWLHRKFSLFVLGLAFVLVARWRPRIAELPGAAVAGLAALFVVPQVALHLWTLAQWGSLGGPLTLERPPFSLETFRLGALGLLLDREHGLLAWAPIYLLVPAAAWVRRRDVWPLIVPALFLFVPSAAHDLWWGGFSPAARFLVPLAPLAALTVGPLVARPAFRWSALALLVPQALISGWSWQHPRDLWPTESGTNPVLEAALPYGDVVQRVFPSVATDGPLAALPALATMLAASAVLVWLDRRAGDGRASAG